MIGSLAIPPSIWFGLMVGGVASGVVALVWSTWSLAAKVRAWRQARLPETRFKALAGDMARAMSIFDAEAREVADPLEHSEVRAILRELTYHLDEFKIPHPPIRSRNAHRFWGAFFPELLGAARAGRLKEARQLYKPR